jgi:hypothetical protein
MAEKNKNNKPAEATQQTETVDIRQLNVIKENIAAEAFEEIEKERDKKQKAEMVELICVSTYNNLKTRAELRARRREDDITKNRLEETKGLFERVIGFETVIEKSGKLAPVKDKPIAADQRLTLSEYKEEKSKMEEKFRKEMNESDNTLQKDLQELRNSYEGRFRYWWD